MMSPRVVDHSSAVVTGGGRGIGAAIVTRLLAEGWSVAVLERDTKEMELSFDQPSLRIVQGDAAVRADVDRACETAAGLAPLTAMVANAGYNRPGPAVSLDRGIWDEIVEINLSAVFDAALSALAHRTAGLSLVAISSIAGLLGLPGRAAYGAAKAGVGGLIRTLAVEWGGLGVRVNAVCPGFVETLPVATAFANGTIDPAEMLNRIPLRRMATPAEIANVVAFLLSDEASYITGVMLPVDGGMAVQGLQATLSTRTSASRKKR